MKDITLNFSSVVIYMYSGETSGHVYSHISVLCVHQRPLFELDFMYGAILLTLCNIAIEPLVKDLILSVRMTLLDFIVYKDKGLVWTVVNILLVRLILCIGL